jgi:hypothetical protein
MIEIIKGYISIAAIITAAELTFTPMVAKRIAHVKIHKIRENKKLLDFAKSNSFFFSLL